MSRFNDIIDGNGHKHPREGSRPGGFCLAKNVECKDGVTLSVQVSEFHYCTPRSNVGPYTHVEVGFPSVKPHEAMMKFAEEPDMPTQTVYGWVPVEVMREFIELHGGEKED